MKWIITDSAAPEGAAEKLAEELKLPAYIISALINREITTAEKAREMLEIADAPLNSPFLFEEMNRAADRILKAVLKKEKIVIYGDYDVDGVTSIAILYLFFRDYLNADNIHFYIPGRHDEGYGMNRDAAEKIINEGAKLIITVDCGITSKDDVAFCRDSGVDVIVTDHHMPGEKTIPDKAAAIINPKYSERYPEKELSGAGVAYKLVCALAEKKGIDIRDEFVDFAALGTIADVVPLTAENRTISARGMKKMEFASNRGLRALKEAAGMKEGKPVNAYHLGFVLGPRINAAGRLEHAKKAVELFIGEDEELIKNAAQDLNRINEERKSAAKLAEEQAMEKIADVFDPEKDFVIVLFDRSWNSGIVGLTASKVLNRFDRPVFVLTMGEDGLVHGSARSVPAVNIYECLKACEGVLEKYGGHKLAAGVCLKEENIDRFREMINEYVKKRYLTEDFEKKIYIDAEINEIIDIKDVRIFEKLQPWGEGNPRPLFCLRSVMIMDVKHFRNNTIKFYAKHGRRYYNFIMFGCKEEHKTAVRKGRSADVVFYPGINEWQGSENLILEVADMEFGEESAGLAREKK